LFVVDKNAFLTRRNSTTQKKRVFLRDWYDSELVFGKQHLVLGKQSYRFLGKKIIKVPGIIFLLVFFVVGAFRGG
jgi:hypothetical protein